MKMVGHEAEAVNLPLRLLAGISFQEREWRPESEFLLEHRQRAAFGIGRSRFVVLCGTDPFRAIGASLLRGKGPSRDA